MRHKWTPEQVLKWIEKDRKDKTLTSKNLADHFGMSRQTAARILRALVHEHKLVKLGSTQTARYQNTKSEQPVIHRLAQTKKLKGLSEDSVFVQMSLRMNLRKLMVQNVFRIVSYAFCEMLNNAIDHSQSQNAEINLQVERGKLQFKIRDKGIGIFKNIRRRFGLKSDEEAIEHLLKGKQTTAPEAHSGQGIFFTSKIADLFEIQSNKYRLKFDNSHQDIRLQQRRPLKGTEVFFEIKTHSKKSLKELFETYANEDFEFDRTTYPIVILNHSGAISRSQARRLTVGLEKFDRVILDFKNVSELGQGFADEIFRIYQNKNPKMIFEIRNANAAVHFMIRRAMAAK